VPIVSENIRTTIDGEGIATLSIDVVDRPMNVLTPGLLRDLESCIDEVARNPAVRGAIVASAKSSFMAGADIKDMASMFERGITAPEAQQFSANLNRVFRRLETSGKP
jgi:3-hydroxyacyl-CoA dehydrogenase/enoyl-CoA hydratase/3-hydroxybutyryl-CoA epimerase